MAEDNDIREAMEEDKSRGRRRYDAAAREKRRRLLQAFRDLVREADEERVREYLVKHLAFAEGSEQFESVLAAWREGQKKS
jgi:hypothetical protein